jgi:hypothetical protein
MTWPASDVVTTSTDADTDSPLTARPHILDLMTKFNQLRNHVTAYVQGLLAAADAAAARATLGLGDSAVQNTTFFWSTGDTKITLKAAADAGWVMMNDGSIGNAASGGTTRANADTSALFTLVWTNVSNTWAATQDNTGTPVARGASAAADFAANRRLVLPKVLGRALAIAGTGSGLSARALGEILGSQDAVNIAHTHTINDPTHAHQQTIATTPGGSQEPAGVAANGSAPISNFTVGAGTGITINSSGVTGTGLNMQPSSFFNIMVKL